MPNKRGIVVIKNLEVNANTTGKKRNVKGSKLKAKGKGGELAWHFCCFVFLMLTRFLLLSGIKRDSRITK